jgi:ribosomal-protein-alanine N-acetyltransferase
MTNPANATEAVKPIIETERFYLRPMTLADSDALLKIWGDPIAMEHYPSTLDRAGMEAWIAKQITRYAETGVGIWAMVLKATGEVIGDCGLAWQVVEGAKELEIGYHVRRDLWGQGLALEAARAVEQYAHEKLGVERVVIMTSPTNMKSRRVVEKLGYRLERQVFFEELDHLLHVRAKS